MPRSKLRVLQPLDNAVELPTKKTAIKPISVETYRQKRYGVARNRSLSLFRKEAQYGQTGRINDGGVGSGVLLIESN